MDMLREYFLLCMAVREINGKERTLLQPNTLPPQIDGSSCGMHEILNVWFLLTSEKRIRRQTSGKQDIGLQIK